MGKATSKSTIRAPDPFDGSARERLERMRIVDEKGQINITAMSVFADIFAGLFYDDLRESLDSSDDLLTIFKTFKALYAKKDYQHMFLLLSIQYDYMGKPLPDPIWLLAGDGTIIKALMTMFIERYEAYLIGDGILQGGKGGISK